ncbi:polyprenyl synthetase family protein [Paramaledivibacter caminithermalis]|uniref:Farnesyl diphosphate synthase n=1 Tax=Paramaledivibacter caminithermalis (strain DSM 15212 / CIP 107654 / DViRD3) TaxID=1121301 RepID=A0A1M6JQE9_PARC5|nr:farnesyl diphosphate synthase [Paramaledivibacter caminithermalis]SHJ48920.1 geranylgeranyl diphosphate synthase, type II [Paramaledivibacter caminithermalis DSM 15212]
MDFKVQLLQRKSKIDKVIGEVFKDKNGLQKTVIEAMEYSIKAGGKRLRPVLLLEVCNILDGDIDYAMPFALAMEMIHTYSLIHDDLPAMDNDDYRRGKLTNHKVYGEGIAILAGDGLLNLAFETMLDSINNDPKLCNRGIKAMQIISKASGINGMIGGQVVDLEWEGKKIDIETLDFIHKHKTSALIEASINAGAILGGAEENQYLELQNYGRCIGLAFQIVDDILDEIGDEEKLGKKVGSDKSNEKSTYPSLYGIEKSKEIVSGLIENSLKSLEIFKEKAEFLRSLAKYLEVRDH